MALSLLLASSVAWGFTSAPSRACATAADCALVKETHCGAISAVRVGEDQAWADFEAKERAKAEAEKRVCPSGPRPDPLDYVAVCAGGFCDAELRRSGEAVRKQK